MSDIYPGLTAPDASPAQVRIFSFVLAQRLAVMQYRVAPVVSAATGGVISTLHAGCHFYLAPTFQCKSNIEMTPLCKVEVTLPRVLGSREVRRGGGVDEQAGVQPS